MKLEKGTTTIAFKFKDGIMVGAESRITHRKSIVSDTKEKFRELSSSSNIFCTVMGKVHVWDNMCLHVQQKIKDEERRLRARTTVFFASEKVLEHLVEHGAEYRKYDKNLKFGTIICGWNEATTAFELYEAHLEGETAWKGECDKAALGSGADFVKDLLEGNDYDNMSTEDAADLALKILFHATLLDKLSGGTLHVFYVHKNGYVEKHNIDPLEVCSQYYKRYHVHELERRTLFLLYPTSYSPISGDDLIELRPKGMILAAHHVAKTRDFHFHRVICMSEEVASGICDLIKKADNEGENRLLPRLDRFSLCELIVNGKHVPVFVQKSSRELLQSICELPGDKKINEQLRPAIITLPPYPEMQQ